MSNKINLTERKVVRNFFEQRGNFDDISYILGGVANKFKEDDLYETLGFKATSKYTAKELFTIW